MQSKVIQIDFGKLGAQDVEVVYEAKLNENAKYMVIESLFWGSVEISSYIKEDAWQDIADKLLDEDSEESKEDDDKGRIIN